MQMQQPDEVTDKWCKELTEMAREQNLLPEYFSLSRQHMLILADDRFSFCASRIAVPSTDEVPDELPICLVWFDNQIDDQFQFMFVTLDERVLLRFLTTSTPNKVFATMKKVFESHNNKPLDSLDA